MTTMLTQEKINSYKNKLEQDRAKIIQEMGEGESHLDFGDDTTDPEEEKADEAEELGNQSAIENVLKDRIAAIDLALNKIKENKYGICEKCGETIEEKILDVVPESHLCESCKANS